MSNLFRQFKIIPIFLVLIIIAVILIGFAVTWSKYNHLLIRTTPADVELNYEFARSSSDDIEPKMSELTFQEETLNSVKPLYGQHTDWHKITLINHKANTIDLVLKFDNPMVDHINVFSYRSALDEYTLKATLGDKADQLTSDERITPNYPITLQPLESKTLLVSSHTSGSPKLPILVMTKMEFQQYRNLEHLIWGTFIGIALLMAVYNLILYLGVRDLTYLAYIGYVMAIMLELGVVHGYGFYLFPEKVQLILNQYIIPLNTLLAYMTLLFAIKFLRFNHEHHDIYKHYTILCYVLLGYFCFSILIPEYITAQLFFVVQMALYYIAYKMVSFNIKERFVWSKYYVFSWLPLFVGAGIGYLLFIGNTPYNFWTRHAFLFSAIFEMTLISMALAERLGNTESQRLYQATHESKFGFANDGMLQKTISRLQEEKTKTPLSLITVEITNYNVISPYLTDKQLSILVFGLAQYIASQLNTTLPVIEIDEENKRNPHIALARGDLLSILVSTDCSKKIEAALKQLSDLDNFNPVQGSIPYRIHCVFGAAVLLKTETNPLELINQAKQAITQAKEKDIPYYLYSPESDLTSERRIKLALDLANAIRNNELELYHQPQIFASDTHITPSELLLRWRHPLYGFISPDEFVNIAEETGLINHLTFWVINRAAKHAKALMTFGIHDYHFSINVSAHDLSQEGFSRDVSDIFNRHNLSVSQFTLELTETTHSIDSDTFNKNLFELNDQGFTLAIDDFGTGYSSLTYASDHPFKELKIDKQFIQDFINSEKHQAVVKATITMAKNLNLNVTAEGVEDSITLNKLKELGCDKLQGYVIAKPMPFKEYLKWRSPNFIKGTKVGENLTLNFDDKAQVY